MIQITPQAYSEAATHLSTCYGIRLPEITPQDNTSIQIGTSVSRDGIHALYTSLVGEEKVCPDIENTLILLSGYVLSDAQRCDGDSFRQAVSRLNRQDRLRLYIFCRDTEKNYEGIMVKGRNGSVKLANTCNWLWNDLLKDYFAGSLPDITSREQAREELVSGMRKRGRAPKDARVPALMWGTYRLITERHHFRTAMPNVLCLFIIRLLQMQNVLPQDTDIDTLWVRAELRYIRDRPEKPLYPV